jgi:3-dehydrotetronate 4-kinase
VRRGAGHILYKICSTFDSTDRGNIGPVMDALRAASNSGKGADGTSLVNPAFPETGRSVYMGHLFVGEQLLQESPLKDHPLNPMRDSNLVRVLGRQSRSPVGLITVRDVAAGPDAVVEKMSTLTESGHGAVVADAVLDDQLETLGHAALTGPISVGASGLGIGIARALIASGRARHHGGAGRELATVGGPALILAGSCSPATLEQIQEAPAAIQRLALDVAKAIQDPQGAAADAVAWAEQQLKGDVPAVLVYSSADPKAVATFQEQHGREKTGTAIESAMAEIAARLVGSSGVQRLIVAGGETSGAVVDALGVVALVIGPRIAPGVPATRAVWQGNADLRLALKSGNFGGRAFFSDALEAMP